jgi:hypothetical protein
MIPPLRDNGYLPPGIHRATLDEIEVRFGGESELRQVQIESLRWLMDLARRGDVQRFVIAGSFVTDIFEPNDVDCVLSIDPHHPHDAEALHEIAEGLPFLDIQLVEPLDFAMLVDRFFATDRHGTPKGVIELIL